MNKDKEIKLLKEAITTLREGSKLGLIKTPKFIPSDEINLEDSLYNEIFNVVNNYKKNRIRNFFNYLSLPESVKSAHKTYFKQVDWACKFLKQNKELLRDYLKEGGFHFMMGSSWVYPYSSGDSITNKISKLGETKPRYKSTTPTFSRHTLPSKKVEEKNKIDELKILESLKEIIEVVNINLAEEIEISESGFKSKFIDGVVEEIDKRFNIIFFNPNHIKAFCKVMDEINPAINKYWKERCEKNLKSSSTQKEEE